MNNFEITLKTNRSEIEILTTRALLAVAAVASFVYAGEQNYYVSIGLGIVLVVLSFYLKTFLDRFKVNRLLLLFIASVFTYITTGTIAFAAVLLVHGLFFEMLKKKVWVQIDAEAVTVHNIISNKAHNWASIQNVILKDDILTIDFNNDRLLQSEIMQSKPAVDESIFNAFCFEQLQKTARL
jgi:hypothetical protein